MNKCPYQGHTCALLGAGRRGEGSGGEQVGT